MKKRNTFWISKERKERENLYLNRERNQKFYQSKDWQRIRLYVLSANPFCTVCDKEVATEVDHIIGLNTVEGWRNRLALDNLQSICKTDHGRKTVKEQQQRKHEENNNIDYNDFD